MEVARLWLTDFRNYREALFEPDPAGLTVVVGRNGQGKTNLLEAIAWLATMGSFRGAPREALVRVGADRGVIRAEGTRQDRSLLVEAELPVSGRDRVLINRQPLRRSRDLLGAVRVTVFSPDDLELIQGGPARRREVLDEALVALAVRHDGLRTDVERVLRQRGALLRQAGGRLTPEVAATLDVWDTKLAELGTLLADARERLAGDLSPLVGEAYTALSGSEASVRLAYRRSWEGDLRSALDRARNDDLRRAVSTVGPHRDDLEVALNAMPARTHASQGEQRSVALAVRLAVHGLVTERVGSAPVLLLDDVFSELDSQRAAALLALLPAGQAVLTTTEGPPPGAAPSLVVRVDGGRVSP